MNYNELTMDVYGRMQHSEVDNVIVYIVFNEIVRW